ncbi:prolipoprotein diacylglyceryl transferase [Candidatus Woesearchaeota archaeon]|nr:prolipoprotein diacylglyceryl transferase [Candidatus Woesearchaeota archaeon]
MFIDNLNPVLLHLGPLEIRYYGLVYVFGFLFTYFLLWKNKEKLGMVADEIDQLILYLIVGLLIGARMFHFLFSTPQIFWEDPLELLKIWHGGMSFFGGLVGVMVAGWIFLRKKTVSFLQVADLIVFPGIATLMIGRLANFINAELVGIPADPARLPWCVIFPRVDMLCRHPYQIYASVSHLFLLIILLVVWKIKQKKQLSDGILFFLFVIGYGVLRFITDFWRDDPHLWLFTIWQYVSLVVVGVSVVVLLCNYQKKERRPNR